MRLIIVQSPGHQNLYKQSIPRKMIHIPERERSFHSCKDEYTEEVFRNE